MAQKQINIGSQGEGDITSGRGSDVSQGMNGLKDRQHRAKG